MERTAPWIIYFIVFSATSSAAILYGPRNTAVELNDDVVLTCTTSEPNGILQWTECISGDGEERVLWQQDLGLNRSHPWDGSYVVGEQHELVLYGVGYQRAGTYSCQMLPPYDVRTYAVLIVVVPPTCATNDLSHDGNQLIEGVFDDLGCSVQYYGAWGPKLEWSENGEVLDGVISNPSGYVRNKYIFAPTAEQNGTTFVCSLYFLAPNGEIPKDEEHDQRTPTFKTTCELDIEVLYTARIVNITGTNTDDEVKTGDEFECEVKGNPEPDVMWISVEGGGPILVDGPVLTVADMEGENTYTCYTNNTFKGRIGTDSRNISFVVAAVVVPTDDPVEESGLDMTGAIVGGAFGGLLIIAAIVTVSYILIKRQNVTSCSSAKQMAPWDPSRRASQDVLENLNRPLTVQSSNLLQARKSNNYINSPHQSSVINRAYTSEDDRTPLREPIPAWEVDRENVVLEKVLGEGHFGIVHKARVHGLKTDTKQKGKTVAVKSLKANASDKDKADLFNELEVMRTLPEHDNVVRLMGCCTVNDPIYILVEFVSNGNLKDFLRLQRSTHMITDRDTAAESTSDGGPDAKELMGFALQVARGMSHISHHQLLHRDLAARNILIGKNKICKVSDFGLARDIIDRNEYHRESSGPLPLRWMAPESIFDNIYTTKSDVWSYGVLLWEIVTLGASPYPGMAPKQVITQVKNGYRMEKPEHCVDEIGHVMQRCWQLDQSERPEFKDIVEELDSLLLAESDYLALENYHAENFAELEPSEEEKV